MSTADDIKKMTQQFVENKTAQNMETLSLEDLALDWSASKDSPDFDAQTQKLAQSLNNETLQNKINEYLVDLHYGRFSPADFSSILEFCEEFGFKSAGTEFKSKIDNLRETMESCRLKMPKDVAIQADDTLQKSLPIPYLDQVTISGNEAIIDDLPDKKSIAGKTFSFTNKNGNEIGGVEYDKNNDAHILYTNNEGNAVEYKLTKDNQFYLVNDDKTETLIDISDPKALSTQDIRAFNLAKSSQKIWNGFINKKLDKSIVKNQTTISDQDKPNTLFNEANKDKTTVNEGGNEEADSPTTTRFDEQTSEKKTESDINNDAANEIGEKPDELYWKEDDIIKVMFQDWFLAFANSATNWAVHQVEYAAAGVWDTIEKSYRNRKMEEQEETPEKPDVTHQFYSGIEDVSSQRTSSLRQSDDNQALIEQIRNGNTQDAVMQNPLLRDFAQQTGIDIGGLLSRGEPEKTVPIITSMATVYAQYTDAYARASLLDEKMNDKHAYDGEKSEDLYNKKVKEAGAILSARLYKQVQNNPQQADFNIFIDTINTAAKDMNNALEFGLKDYKKERYDENGKDPKDNTVLHEYQNDLRQNEPRTLQEFTAEQSAIIRNRDYIVSGLNIEQSQLDAATQDINLRRQNAARTRQFIMGGLNSEHRMINVTENHQAPVIPLRPQGRE